MAKDIMSKPKTDLVDGMVDEAPAKGPPNVATMTPPPPAVLAKAEPAPPAVPKQAIPKTADERFPWGFLVKHPGYGSLRVRRDEASTEADAIEVYRQKKAPHMKTAQLTDTGMRIAVTKFVPAETERGK